MTTKRAERFFHLIGILKSGRGYTSAELAKMLGVSQRTIFRDIVDLSSLVSIYYDDGYRLLTETSIANVALTRDELLALRLGVRIPPLRASSHLAAATRSALVKLDEILERRFGQPWDDDAISVDVSAYSLSAEATKVLEVLEEAVRKHFAVVIHYYTLSRNEETKRTVDPYGLTFRRHSWYLVGWCHLRRAERVFRLDRVLKVEKTGRTFQRPASFSLEKFFADAWEVYASGKIINVKLRFSPFLGPVVKPALAPRGSFRAAAEGLLFEGRVPASDEFCRWLLTFGEDVEVLAPPELRQDVARRLEAAAALYGRDKKRAREK